MKKQRILAFFCIILLLMQSFLVQASELDPTESQTLIPAEETTTESETETTAETTSEGFMPEQSEESSKPEAETETAAEESSETEPVIDMANVTTDAITQFVIRAYQLILFREPETEGLNYWVGYLTSKQLTAAQMCKQFFESKEFALANVSDGDYVNILYRVCMGREADSEGFLYWTGLLSDGVSRTFLLKGFLGSKEFELISNSYGIEHGSIETKENRDVNVSVTAYVMRCYRYILSRDGEAEGLNYWTGLINSGQKDASSILVSFFGSTEFQLRNVNDTEYIKILYLTCMGREYDAEGLTYWENLAASGMSRTYILSSFVSSAEFSAICASYGVRTGTIQSTGENRDRSASVTTYIAHVYTTLLGRNVDIAALNYLAGLMLDGGKSAGDIAKNIINSSEFSFKNYSDTDYITRLFQCFWNRDPGSDELSSWQSGLQNDTSRSGLLTFFMNSNQFIELYGNVGNTPMTITLTSGTTYGMDVSRYQSSIDWSQVAASGIEFVIIRCGYRQRETGIIIEDPYFKANIEGALKHGIKVGIYFYSQAINITEAIEEAQWVLNKIKGYEVTYPIAYDLENIGEYRIKDLTKTERTTNAIAFMNHIASNGYTPMMYASQSGYNSNWETSRIAGRYMLWVARYGVNNGQMNKDQAPQIGYDYDMWQYTSKGTVAGISGDVDLNVAYFKYSAGY